MSPEKEISQQFVKFGTIKKFDSESFTFVFNWGSLDASMKNIVLDHFLYGVKQQIKDSDNLIPFAIIEIDGDDEKDEIRNFGCQGAMLVLDSSTGSVLKCEDQYSKQLKPFSKSLGEAKSNLE